MAWIQLLVCENKRASQNWKVGHVTPRLIPFDLICIFSVMPLACDYTALLQCRVNRNHTEIHSEIWHT